MIKKTVSVELSMTVIVPNPKQPRTIFDRAELEELAASIREHGLLEPILVRASGGGLYEIACGERRWRAHQLLGAESIRAEVVDLTDDQLADVAIVENLQRKDISPLEEAKAFQRQLDTGISVEDLARRLGLKQPWRITQRTQLLRLTPEYQDALARGILTPNQAQEMSKLSPLRQRLVFDAIGAGKCPTQWELYRIVQAHQAADAQRDLFAAPPDDGRAKARALDALKKIDALQGTMAAGWSNGEIVALADTTEGRSGVLADRLEMMEKALKKLRLDITARNAVRAA